MVEKKNKRLPIPDDALDIISYPSRGIVAITAWAYELLQECQ